MILKPTFSAVKTNKKVDSIQQLSHISFLKFVFDSPESGYNVARTKKQQLATGEFQKEAENKKIIINTSTVNNTNDDNSPFYNEKGEFVGYALSEQLSSNYSLEEVKILSNLDNPSSLRYATLEEKVATMKLFSEDVLNGYYKTFEKYKRNLGLSQNESLEKYISNYKIKDHTIGDIKGASHIHHFISKFVEGEDFSYSPFFLNKEDVLEMKKQLKEVLHRKNKEYSIKHLPVYDKELIDPIFDTHSEGYYKDIEDALYLLDESLKYLGKGYYVIYNLN